MRLHPPPCPQTKQQQKLFDTRSYFLFSFRIVMEIQIVLDEHLMFRERSLPLTFRLQWANLNTWRFHSISGINASYVSTPSISRRLLFFPSYKPAVILRFLKLSEYREALPAPGVCPRCPYVQFFSDLAECCLECNVHSKVSWIDNRGDGQR